jgi:hypothetical protein
LASGLKILDQHHVLAGAMVQDVQGKCGLSEFSIRPFNFTALIFPTTLLEDKAMPDRQLRTTSISGRLMCPRESCFISLDDSLEEIAKTLGLTQRKIRSLKGLLFDMNAESTILGLAAISAR